MPANTASVTLPPPMRSASLPPYTRDSEPSSGPMNAIWAACSDACAAALPACGEVDLQHLAEREREADERAEGADVEQRDHPGVTLPQDRAHRGQVDLVLLQVVHVQRGADPGDGQRDQVDRAHPVGLPVARRWR